MSNSDSKAKKKGQAKSKALRSRGARPVHELPDYQKIRQSSRHQDGQVPTESGIIESFDGTPIFYAAEGDGPPLVFCYGLVCSVLHWTYQIEFFKHHYRCIWFDYRGHHRSKVPARKPGERLFSLSMTIENFAKDLHMVLQKLQVQKPVMLGHSMGVNVVLEYSHQHPDIPKGMVLANGTARRPLETMFGTNKSKILFDGLRWLHRLSPTLMNQLWVRWGHSDLARFLVSVGGGFNPLLTPKEDIQLYLKRVADLRLATFLQLLDDYEKFDASPWLHTLQIPTLLIGGEIDQVVPLSEQRLLHQLIPGSQLVMLPKGSHCPQMDLPELTNQKIQEFLLKVSH